MAFWRTPTILLAIPFPSLENNSEHYFASLHSSLSLSLSLYILSFTCEYSSPQPGFSCFCLFSLYFCFSPSCSAFSKLNSGVNPCSFCPPEKKRGQRGKDSSLFGINIKMKVAYYFSPPPTPHKKGRVRWQEKEKGERKEQGAQSKGKRRVKAERCRKKEKKNEEEREREGGNIWGDRGKD